MSIIKKRVKNYNRYSKSLKRKIAKEYLSGQASYTILAEENDLRDKTVVKEFVKWYRRELEKDPEFESTELSKSEEMDSSKKTEKSKEELEKQVLEMRNQLRQIELKAEMFETMLDLAEKEFGIEIRKKFGAKQLNK